MVPDGGGAGDVMSRMGSVGLSTAVAMLPAMALTDTQTQAVVGALSMLIAAATQLVLALTAESRERRARLRGKRQERSRLHSQGRVLPATGGGDETDAEVTEPGVSQSDEPDDRGSG